MKKRILFVTHKAEKCGIAQYGRDTLDALAKSDKYEFIRKKVESMPEFAAALIDAYPHAATVFNYPTELRRWLMENSPEMKGGDAPRILIEHDHSTQAWADSRVENFFTDYVFFNPALVPNNPRVHTVRRFVPATPPSPEPGMLVKVGTFGFATEVKRLEWFAHEIKTNFEDHEIMVRMHMPANDVVDPDGSKGVAAMGIIAQELHGYTAQLSKNYKTKREMVEWLAANDLNVFFYDPSQNGLSSAVDLAIAAGKPVALNKVNAFAHLFGRKPSPFVEDYPYGHGLKSILRNGDDFDDLRRAWSEENFVKDWEKVLDEIIGRGK